MPRQSLSDRALVVKEKPKGVVTMATWQPTTSRRGKRRFKPVETEFAVKTRLESPEKRTRGSSPTKQGREFQPTPLPASVPDFTWSQGDLDVYGALQITHNSNKSVSLFPCCAKLAYPH